MTDPKGQQVHGENQKDPATKSSRLALAVALAGPLSIPMLLVLASAVGGFGGMGTWLMGGMLLVPFHLCCAVFLVVHAVLRKRRGLPMGSPVIFGFVYYACAAIFALPWIMLSIVFSGALRPTGPLWLIGSLSSGLLVTCLWLGRSRSSLARRQKLDDGIAVALTGLFSVLLIASASAMGSVTNPGHHMVVTVMDASSHPLQGVKAVLFRNSSDLKPFQVLMTDQEGRIKLDSGHGLQGIMHPYSALIRFSKAGYRDCKLDPSDGSAVVSWRMRDGRWTLAQRLAGRDDLNQRAAPIQIYLPKAEGDDALPYRCDLSHWKRDSYEYCLFLPQVGFGFGKPNAVKEDAALAERFDRFCQRGTSILIDVQKTHMDPETSREPGWYSTPEPEERLRIAAYALIDDPRIEASTDDYLAACKSERGDGGSDGGGLDAFGENRTIERYLKQNPDAPIRPYLVLRLVHLYGRRLKFGPVPAPPANDGESWEGGHDVDASKYAQWSKEANESSDPLVRFFAGEITNDMKPTSDR